MVKIKNLWLKEQVKKTTDVKFKATCGTFLQFSTLGRLKV